MWVFATGPIHLDEDGDDLREDLGRALSDAVGERVEIRAERSYSTLLERVLARSVAMAWLPPVLFVRAHAKDAVGAVLRTERASGGRYQSALFVRDGSPIHRPHELSGSRVAWVDHDSCAGYLFPRLALRAAQLDPDACFSSETFAESHSRVVRAVESGAADVGATHVQLVDADDPSQGIALAGWAGFTDAKAMRAVLVSPPIPSDAVCLASGLDPAVEGVLSSALTTLHARPSGATLLRAMFAADRLVVGAEEDYAPVRAALEAEGMLS